MASARAVGSTQDHRVTIRFAIGFKIFAVALALLVLMSVATLLMVRMVRDVGNELDFFARTYLPAYAAIARTNDPRDHTTRCFARRSRTCAENSLRTPSPVSSQLRQSMEHVGEGGVVVHG